MEKEKQSMKRWTGILVSILAVCLSLSAMASGVEYDSDGGVWDYNKGTYTISDGKTVLVGFSETEYPSHRAVLRRNGVCSKR